MSNTQQRMIDTLQQLLQQLEAAQGGPDPEARAQLNQLRQQLGVLEQAKEWAAAAAAGSGSDAMADAAASNGAAAASSAATLSAGPAGTAAVVQQMDGLAERLLVLEQKVAGLDEGSRAVLLQSAGGWLGTLEETGGGSRSGSVGGSGHGGQP